jgi:hypothetical protein
MLWQLSGRTESVTDTLRSIVLRLARATGGGVEYWLSLPIQELIQFMLELADQLEQERQAAERR